MASLIFGFIASMGTILVILMVLLNSYLQRNSFTATQQEPPPAIGPSAASERLTGQVPPISISTDGSPSGQAAPTLAIDAEVSKDARSTPAPVKDPDKAPPPAAVETATAMPENAETPIAAPAEAENSKPQKSASRHKVARHQRSRRSRFNSEGPYGNDSFSGDGTRF